MTFSEHPQVRGDAHLRCERTTRCTHDHLSQQAQTKEMMDTCAEKRSGRETQQGQMSD